MNVLFRDILSVATITIITFFITRYLNFSERFYQWSRKWEDYQADELVFPLLMFSICLIWFSWRRYLEAKHESNSNTLLLSENRRLIQDQTQKQEHERLFLAQELHDVFAQYLTALRTHGELIQTLINQDDKALYNASQNIIVNVDKLHQLTRSLLSTLRPPLLEFGVGMAIEDLVTDWQKTHKNIQCNLEFHGDEPDLNEEELLTLYRATQEGLSNVARHAKAHQVNVDIYFPDKNNSIANMVCLELINDGSRNFESNNNTLGLGLIGIRERVSMLQGSFEIAAHTPEGTKIKLSFPTSKQEIA